MTEILKPWPTHHWVTESPRWCLFRFCHLVQFVVWKNREGLQQYPGVAVSVARSLGRDSPKKIIFQQTTDQTRFPFKPLHHFLTTLSIYHCLSSKGIQSVHIHFNFFSNISTCWSSTFAMFSREVTAISLTEMLFGRLDVVESLRIYFPITGFFFYLFFMVSWRLWIEPMKWFQCGKMVGFDKIAGEHSRSGVLVG